MEDTRTLKELAKEALDIQWGSNLGGLVLGWGRAVQRLRQLCPELDTDALNHHPINVLWSDKLATLAGRGYNAYSEASNWASDQTWEGGE
jgi:hypothetical protein